MPPSYHEVLYWKLASNVRQLVLINLLAIPLALIGGVGFVAFALPYGLRAAFQNESGFKWVAVLLAVVLTLVLHELVHGVCMRAFGAQPRYGVKLEALALYATAPGYAFTRNQYLIVILAPLVVLSVLALLGIVVLANTLWVPALVAGAVTNASGACGDVYMAWLTARYPDTAYVVDEADGMRVFMKSEE
jgi:hypothetical protein